MKLVTYRRSDESLRPAVLVEGGAIDLVDALPERPASLSELFERRLVQQVSALLQSKPLPTVKAPHLVAPIPKPGKIFGIGLNYRDHAIESGMAIPDEPIVFVKLPSAVIGPNDAIVIPECTNEVDYEAELVVVIGRIAKHVAESEALNCVAGYTIGNDVSARDFQLRKPGGQWSLGKSFDTFAPLGPAIVTPDEVSDPHDLGIVLRLNDRIVQNSRTSQLIFPIEKLIAYLSSICQLDPGDLIFTGTPPGVGFARKPPQFLKPGDKCEIEIEELGTLANLCRSDGQRIA